MFRSVLSLLLVVGALFLALTPRGYALLGSSRSMLVVVLVMLGAWQAYRLSSIIRAQRHGDLLKRIPKRPLGL